MLEDPSNVFEADVYIVIVANRVQVNSVPFRPGGVAGLRRSATAHEEAGASQEALPWC